MAHRPLTKTDSPFWWEPDVTKLIADARNDPDSRNRLTNLVFRSAFRRLDEWLAAAGLKQVNMRAEDIFDRYWASGLATALNSVDFQDREHFLKNILMRMKQLAERTAGRLRRTREEPLGAYEPESKSDAPGKAAEHAEKVTLALRAMQNLKSPRYEIVILHIFEGMTFRQMADELNMPPSTVHHEFENSLKELREAIT